MENNVIHFVDGQKQLEKAIEICIFKYKHFKDFLHALPQDHQMYLKARYLQEEEMINDGVDRECIEIIQEIEEAVSYRFFGSEPGTYIDDAPDVYQVSEEEFAEAFDDAFLKMISRLG